MNKLLVGSIAVILVALYYTQWRGSNTTREGRIVKTRSGSVQGIISLSRDGREFEEWLGIPYAEPPVGELRFAAPKPVKPWDGVREGGKHGSSCAQVLPLGGINLKLGSEDCLFLNVHAPQSGDDQDRRKLPVMVWIHGGGFYLGSATRLLPDYFMDEDVVLVSLNYRLGAFGFLCPGDGHIKGNMGLKDQELALKWVRDNIEAFGGDPKRITIFGESAGGASVHHQTVSPTTQGLFHKAIAQSGVAAAPWATHSATDARKMAEKFAKTVGCGSEGATSLAKCLTNKSMEELLEASAPDLENWYVQKPYKSNRLMAPCIEAADSSEAFITEHPLDIVKGGRAHRIPLMIGSLADDGLISAMGLVKYEENLNEFEANWTANVGRTFGIPETSKMTGEITEKLRNYYVPEWEKLSKDERSAAYTRMLTDAHFNFHMHHVIDQQRQFSPVFAYHYTRRGGPSGAPLFGELAGSWPLLNLASFLVKTFFMNMFGIKHPDYGVSHADELAMLSPTALVGPRVKVMNEEHPDYLLSKQLVKLWVDFASSDGAEMQFRGASFRHTGTNGPIEYFEITDQRPGMVRASFENRAEFLKSLNLLRPETLQ